MSKTAGSHDLDAINALDDAQDILREATKQFAPNIALACSFSKEDIAIIHLLKQVTAAPRVFALDTGRLPEATFECAEEVRVGLGVEIEWFFPQREATEKLIREKGLYSFRESLENRHQCCFIRKVEPLGRALSGLDAWITGLRRQQNVTRNDLQPASIDEANDGIIKINPLANWTDKQVDDYVAEHGLPVNKLHKVGYASIGCAPCTRPIEPGEDPRAGRWWWENPEHKECGLHQKHADLDEEGKPLWII